MYTKLPPKIPYHHTVHGGRGAIPLQILAKQETKASASREALYYHLAPPLRPTSPIFRPSNIPTVYIEMTQGFGKFRYIPLNFLEGVNVQGFQFEVVKSK